MDDYKEIYCLRNRWQHYLRKHGHYICKTSKDILVMRSRNGKKKRYRWLLFTGQPPGRLLKRFEQAAVLQHLQQAESDNEAIYLVVGFIDDSGRIVVLPATAALEAGYIRSHKGGIDWDI